MSKLRLGRGRHSMLVLAADNCHVFVFYPGWAGKRERTPSYGVTLRRRRAGSDDWTHYRVIVFQRNRPNPDRMRSRRLRFAARPTLTLLELAQWKTVGGTTDRVGLKAYVRLKLSAGGRNLEGST